MATHRTKMLIIGSGPAGYSAAIYGARAMMEPIVVQGLQPGGQLTITTDVENYPGFADVVQGPWLMEQMQKQAEHVGTRMMWDTITQVDLTSRPFRLIGEPGQHRQAGRPIGGRRPTVVDDGDQRPLAGQPGTGVEQRMGRRQDNDGGQKHAQDQQPGRRFGGTFLAGPQN